MQRSTSIELLAPARIDRRGFVLGCGAAGLLTTGAFTQASGTLAQRLPVCALHNDQPYLDSSGRQCGYRPPVGARGAAALALLDDVALRQGYCYAV